MGSRKYQNVEPISDVTAALLLLVGEFGDKTQRRLEIRTDEPPFIKVEHYGGHYDEVFATDYYLISDEVVQKLHDEGFVEGMKHWGYTDEKEMEVTDRGRTFLRSHTVERPG